MEGWRSLRKSGSPLHVGYGSTYSNNLIGKNFEYRVRESFEMRVDLSGNLRSRNTECFSYVDARELADGAVLELRRVEILEDQVLENLSRAIEQIDDPTGSWLLIVVLDKEYRFEVRPEFRAGSLFLEVEAEGI